ncbi:MAG: DUF167 domain-containing protein [Chthonomonadales bacterium]
MEPARVVIHVTPRAAANRLACDGERIRAWVCAVPAGGEANEAVIRLLAEALDVPRSRIRIVRGHTARVKIVSVEGLSIADVLDRIPGGKSS